MSGFWKEPFGPVTGWLALIGAYAFAVGAPIVAALISRPRWAKQLDKAKRVKARQEAQREQFATVSWANESERWWAAQALAAEHKWRTDDYREGL